MDKKALRRPGHEGRLTTELIHRRQSHRRFADAPRVIEPAQLVARWTRNKDGRLVMEWTLKRPESNPGSTTSEDAMAESDRSPRTKRGARLRGSQGLA